jgi:hypothetical protein
MAEPADPAGAPPAAAYVIVIACDAEGHVAVKSSIQDRRLFFEMLQKAQEVFVLQLIEATEQEERRVIPVSGPLPPGLLLRKNQG